jgi:hypothetical protein
MREGDRVMLVADFERIAGGTIQAGTFGLLGVTVGNVGHVMLDGGGSAIVPVSLLRAALPRQSHQAETSDPEKDKP